MFIDARSRDDGETVECDLCVIGAGAAGITLAHQLREGRERVCVLESGGFEPDLETQDLYAGTGSGQVGGRYLVSSRLRYFGGSTNHWWGFCAPLDAHDFDARSDVAHSGWPISRGTLDPYYARAQSLCELGPYDYDPASWDPREPPPLGPRTRIRMWQHSPPTRFGTFYRGALERSESVHVYLHANAVKLVPGEGRRQVRHVEVATLSGRRFRVSPGRVVLAAGGIENARLLLASDDGNPAGLGNEHDLIGRFFMDHPHCSSAGSILFDEAQIWSWSQGRRGEAGTFRFNLGVDPETQRREGLLNGSFSIHLPKSTSDELERAVLGLSRDVLGRSGVGLVREAAMFARFEQAPDPESRVRLADERDPLGMRRTDLDWRVGKRERDSIRRTLEILAEDFASVGTARIRIADWLADGEPFAYDENFVGGDHHMGTTRMSDDAHQGVVDRDCRVHGLANLYVAGSSVFPTSGWANPTLTLLALTLRLADHLEQTPRA